MRCSTKFKLEDVAHLRLEVSQIQVDENALAEFFRNLFIFTIKDNVDQPENFPHDEDLRPGFCRVNHKEGEVSLKVEVERS